MDAVVPQFVASEVTSRYAMGSCQTAPSFRLFVPNSLTVYRRFLLLEVSARDVTFLGCSFFPPWWSPSNHYHRSVHSFNVVFLFWFLSLFFPPTSIGAGASTLLAAPQPTISFSVSGGSTPQYLPSCRAPLMSCKF
jgi:hypothetical protein